QRRCRVKLKLLASELAQKDLERDRPGRRNRRDADPANHERPMFSKDDAKRRTRDLLASLGFLEYRCLRDARAQVIADWSQKRAKQERDAPAPLLENFGCKNEREQRRQNKAGEVADLSRDLVKAADKSALAEWSVFDQKGGGTTPFTTSREALRQTQDQQQNRCPYPDLVITRKKRH